MATVQDLDILYQKFTSKGHSSLIISEITCFNTLAKLYEIQFKMYTMKSKFYSVQTILPRYLCNKVMWRNYKCMVQYTTHIK